MRLLSRALGVVAGLTLAACEAYDPIVICHNSNCYRGSTEKNDDTLPALEKSMKLTTVFDGQERPTIDGVEVDTFWHRERRKCFFMHDTGRVDDPCPVPENAVEACRCSDAAKVVAARLSNDSASWNGERFYVKIELKPSVDAEGRVHNSQDAADHTAGVLAMVEILIAGLDDAEQALTIIFDSPDNCLHSAFLNRDNGNVTRYEALKQRAEILHSGPVSDRGDCADITLSIRTFWINAHLVDNQIESFRPAMAYDRYGGDGTEALNKYGYLEPEYISTAHARLVRGWLNGRR